MGMRTLSGADGTVDWNEFSTYVLLENQGTAQMREELQGAVRSFVVHALRSHATPLSTGGSAARLAFPSTLACFSVSSPLPPQPMFFAACIGARV